MSPSIFSKHSFTSWRRSEGLFSSKSTRRRFLENGAWFKRETMNWIDSMVGEIGWGEVKKLKLRKGNGVGGEKSVKATHCVFLLVGPYSLRRGRRLQKNKRSRGILFLFHYGSPFSNFLPSSCCQVTFHTQITFYVSLNLCSEKYIILPCI